MSGDTTTSDWQGYDFTEHTYRRLMTDVSRVFNNMSNESRVKRRKDKLREDLVNEYIEKKQKSKSPLSTRLKKWLKPG